MTENDSRAVAQSGDSPVPAPDPSVPTRKGIFALPSRASWKRIRWNVALAILGVHLLALFAAMPWLFSWSGVALAIIGLYLFGMLGINIGFHRLLTHRSFKTPRWLERCFALLGVCCLEGSPPAWVAHHRLHHQHSDHEEDPHSPIVAFLWSHIGWMLVHDPSVDCPKMRQRYAMDLWKDKFYAGLDRHGKWLVVYVAHAALFFLGGCVFAMSFGHEGADVIRLGLSWVVWGVIVRTVLVWHITWSVNSLTHMSGYRNYETNENSRNNWLVAILAHGEGWHNNHHADQRSAAHGHRWWEFDITYLTILALKSVGLAHSIVQPRIKDPSRQSLHHHAHAED